jgi:hypothetical protein
MQFDRACICIEVALSADRCSPLPSRECNSMFLTMVSARFPCWATFSRLPFSKPVNSSTFPPDLAAHRDWLEYAVQLVG